MDKYLSRLYPLHVIGGCQVVVMFNLAVLGEYEAPNLTYMYLAFWILPDRVPQNKRLETVSMTTALNQAQST